MSATHGHTLRLRAVANRLPSSSLTLPSFLHLAHRSRSQFYTPQSLPSPRGASLPSCLVAQCEAWLASLEGADDSAVRRLGALIQRLAVTDISLFRAAARDDTHVLNALRVQLRQMVCPPFERAAADTCAEYLPRLVERRLNTRCDVDWHAIGVAYALLWRWYGVPGGERQWWSSLLRVVDFMWHDAENASLMFLLPFVMVTECPDVRVLCQLFQVLRCGHDFSVFTAMRFVLMLPVQSLTSSQRSALLESAVSFPEELFITLVQQLSE